MRIAFLSVCFLVACGGRIDGDGSGSGIGGGSGTGGGSGSGNGSGGGSGSGFVCSGKLATASEPRKLASDGAWVYWSTWGDPGTQKNGSIWRVRVTGGTPEKLADDPETTTELAVDDARVYWVGHGAHVASVPKSGGAMSIVTTGEIEHVALDSGFVYASRADRVVRVDKTTNAESTVTTGDGIDPIAVSDRLWFVERNKGAIRWAPKSGGDAHTVATSADMQTVYELVADSTGAYAVTTNGGSVWYATETSLTVRAGGFQCPGNVAIRGSDLYFGNVAIACKSDLDDSQRAVLRLRSGATSVAGHAMIEGINGIAVDDASVYWSGGDGIYCAPR